MYCKNCGRKLPEDARFCDRCNMSVRKKVGRRAQIQSLKEERLARKRAQEIEERRKNIIKAKRRKCLATVYVILGVLILGGVSILVSYCANSRNNAFEPEEIVTQAPEPTVPPKATGVIEGVNNGEGYIEVAVQNSYFAYPEEFVNGNNPEKKLLVLNENDGGATITFSKEITSHDAVALMEKYRDSIENAKAKDSLASSSGYSITVEAGDMIYHKKSYVSNGAELYYEFVYPKNSAKTLDYEIAIKYMDEHFKLAE